MEAPYSLVRPAGFSATLRPFSLARRLFALFGLAVLVGFGTPPARHDVGHPSAPSVASGAPVDPSERKAEVVSLRAIAANHARENEQRAVAEFISRRYRVAADTTLAFVSSAYRAGEEHSVDPLLILAVMAVESRFNPVAESVLGAKGLMQVLPKYHQDKLFEHGGEIALLEPEVNIQVGTQILREYLRRSGETGAALQMYAGAGDEPTSQYSGKVLAERARLQSVARARRATA